MTSIRILIVDDHPVFRLGLEALVGSQDDLQVVGDVGTCAEALSAASKLSPDVILLDLNLPDDSGLDLIKRLKLVSPAAAVVVLSSHEGDMMVQRALREGARGYVSKHSLGVELLQSIRNAHKGVRALSNDVAKHFGESFTSQDLTAQELKVLAQVAKGLSNAEVARALGIGANAVRNSLSGIFAKLEVENRADAALTALSRGIIDHVDPRRPR